jgi:hypothetical protein
VFYTSGSTLLNKSKLGDFVATLDKGAKVYQRATTDSNSYTLKKKGIVQICKVKGDWALVQTLGERGLYAFVQIDQLKNITRI